MTFEGLPAKDEPGEKATFWYLLPTLRMAQKDLKLDDYTAQLFAWHVGAVALVFAGVFKILFAPLGNLVRRLVPRGLIPPSPSPPGWRPSRSCPS